MTAISAVAACSTDQTVGLTSLSPSESKQLAVVAATPQSFMIFPSLINGDVLQTPTGYINVGAAATVDRTLQVTTNSPALLPNLVTSVVVPAGASDVLVQTVPTTVTTATSATVTVSGGGGSRTATVTVYPAGATLPAPLLASIVSSPLTVAAGTSAAAIVTLTGPAPAGGVDLLMFSKLPLTAQLPATAHVPAGARSISVPITTSIGFPNSTTTAQISAAQGATIVSNGINVATGAPTSPAPLAIGVTTLNAPIVGGIATVTGGTIVQGTVSITGPAPAGGALVTLVSTDTTVATVPPTVVIAAGATAASFTITTKTVSAATSSNVGGGFAGGFNVATLRVNPGTTSPPVTPPPAGPLAAPSLASPAADARFAPNSAITFAWSDVSGGESYAIQISDSDKFTSFVVNQNVTPSQFTTTTLPTKTLWWRVRANASGGAAGIWSAARRFELN